MQAFKKLIFILVFVVITVQIFVLFLDKDETNTPEQHIVAVSSFSLYDILNHIAQDTLKTVNILPLGVDPHSFEPTPKLMGEIEKSDIVFYNGAGLEPWIHGFSFKNKAIDVSEHVQLRELDENADKDEHETHGHEHGEHCSHSGNTVDPHYWLDFKNMQKVVLLVKNELIELQPEHKDIYEKNAGEYTKMLQQLEIDYAHKLTKCDKDIVIVNHNAIGYLSHNYDFRVESLSGLSPEAQPSPKDLTRIFEHIKHEGASTIFFENFVNDKAIRSIAEDAKVNLEVFQTLGNITAEEADQNLTYKDIMYINLEKLSKALVCQ